ncbi:HalOD1 output domain-containing protein [Halomarina halobia]|uniref:HalOD1 output domain-containing protein n=1 Tax=Halomarina halobia TaxID=3033386 RepID=A0ABD6A5Z9_9EURY|nr:HalOD1 output domain-containing protein [Halomarina sp. PSR21]
MSIRSVEQYISDDDTGVIRGRASVDWASSDPVIDAVIDALVEVTGTDATDLDPLFEYVDPDALTALFQPTSNATPPAVTAMQFAYDEYAVVVTADEVFVIEH